MSRLRKLWELVAHLFTAGSLVYYGISVIVSYGGATIAVIEEAPAYIIFAILVSSFFFANAGLVLFDWYLSNDTRVTSPENETNQPIRATAQTFVKLRLNGTVMVFDSYNISSVTDNGSRDITVNFHKPFPDVNFIVDVKCGEGSIDYKVVERRRDSVRIQYATYEPALVKITVEE